MSIFGFEIRSAADFFRKLLEEREDFLKNPSSSRHAINCSLAAWHLSEWVYNEFKSSCLSEFKDKNAYRAYLKNRCPELQTIHNLADGSKHFALKQGKVIVVDTLIMTGRFSRSFKDPGHPYLVVKMNENNFKYTMTFDDIFYLVTHFWYRYFLEDLKIDVDPLVKNYTPF